MLAYFDSCGGLVPVKIISASRDEFVVKVTSNNHKEYGYKHGEVFATTHRWVVPLDCVRRHKYVTKILSYSWAKILFGEVV